MATLVLTAVGTVVGGPIGGAIGALIGQQADAVLFAPKARHGPRLGDLAVQTSSYGSAIPKIFGTMRVAGTVIWSTEIKERRGSSGGGKGRPKLVEYSYSASLAVALSGRPVAGVRRIWADGKLLRGAGGDFKSPTGFRLHNGGEDQAPDPLIASVEGIGRTPAFRGIAYAVFEDLELADFGNRIPSLTFELVAEEQAVSVGAIAAELSGGVLADGGTPAVRGFAASGDSVRGAMTDVAELMSLPLSEQGGTLRIGEAVDGAAVIAAAEMTQPSEIRRGGSDKVPGEVGITYYDGARDYQISLQRAIGGGGTRSEQVGLAAVLDAGEAKSLAERRLAMLGAGRATARISLMPQVAGVRPGALVRMEGQAGLWRAGRWTLGADGVAIDLVRVATGSLAPAPASAGRVLGAPDVVAGPTRLLLLDMPLADGGEAGGPRLLALAAGETEEWREARLSVSLDGGSSWSEAGTTAAPAVIGRALSLLEGAGESALMDLAGSVEVELLHPGMWIESRNDAALGAGQNLAVLGGELIQFGRADYLGGRRFRLSRLLRGRRGTEGVEHEAGEAFAMVERGALVPIDLSPAAIGSDVKVRAHGRGDGDDGVEATVTFAGVALQPPAPVHLRAERIGGGLSLSWTRRSRSGWDWLNGGDAPLAEEREAYQVIMRGPGGERTLETAIPQLTIAADDLPEAPLEIEVRQAGRFGLSRPCRAAVE